MLRVVLREMLRHLLREMLRHLLRQVLRVMLRSMLRLIPTVVLRELPTLLPTVKGSVLDIDTLGEAWQDWGMARKLRVEYPGAI